MEYTWLVVTQNSATYRNTLLQDKWKAVEERTVELKLQKNVAANSKLVLY